MACQGIRTLLETRTMSWYPRRWRKSFIDSQVFSRILTPGWQTGSLTLYPNLYNLYNRSSLKSTNKTTRAVSFTCFPVRSFLLILPRDNTIFNRHWNIETLKHWNWHPTLESTWNNISIITMNTNALDKCPSPCSAARCKLQVVSHRFAARKMIVFAQIDDWPILGSTVCRMSPNGIVYFCQVLTRRTVTVALLRRNYKMLQQQPSRCNELTNVLCHDSLPANSPIVMKHLSIRFLNGYLVQRFCTLGQNERRVYLYPLRISK